MAIEWIDVADDVPLHGEVVIGVILQRYVNADWQWGGPHVYRFSNGQFVGDDNRLAPPDMWARAYPPSLPECPERDKARAIGEKVRDLSARRDALTEQIKAVTYGH